MSLMKQPTGTPTLPDSQDGLSTAATQSKSLKPTKAGSTKDCGSQSGRGLKQPKPRKCKVCRTEFVPTKPMQSVCGLSCALSLASVAKAKRERTQAAQERKETKAKLKTRGEWIADAQAAFNRYIRLRDAGKPCICCGLPMGPNVPGGAVDAGHYRSRGSAPHLRFDERNVHAQRKQCNRYDSGNVLGYRFGLRERIGIEAVEALEADQTPRTYTVDDLKAIKAKYTALARDLEKANG